MIGHFGFGKELLNGQTIKTKTVTTELERQLGADQIIKIDTHGGVSVLPKVICQMAKAFRSCENIIIFPAHNGVRVFVPLCVFFNRFHQRKLHYVVIGGWLDSLLDGHSALVRLLKNFTGIYVETQSMQRALNQRGLSNVVVMPNFKNLHILDKSELVYSTGKPYRLCTFSRVMKEKGIEDAIEAVKKINESHEEVLFELDIFGQVDDGQLQWFENLEAGFPKYIRYGGFVPFDKTVDVLKKYYALLFPTYYSGEGFAGTLLDAMAAGVPVVASDWKYNSEIVIPGKTGILVKAMDREILVQALESTLDDWWNAMKVSCIKEACKHSPVVAIQVLMNRL